jgi:hypothetical protein
MYTPDYCGNPVRVVVIRWDLRQTVDINDSNYEYDDTIIHQRFNCPGDVAGSSRYQ